MFYPRALLVFGLLAFAGCATAPSTVSDRLFFGRNIPGTTGEVSDAQWNAFVNEVIVPRFPDGFTVWTGAGQWKGEDGKEVSERTLVMELVHKTDPAVDTKFAEIAQAYRQRFNQEAVLGVRAPAQMTFWRR